MTERASAFWARARAHRLASTLFILLTLAVGILIGTVVSFGVKGKEARLSDAAQLTIPAAQPMANQFTTISKQLEPSVVNINTDMMIKNPHRGTRRRPAPNAPDDEDNNPFDFFPFGGQIPGMPQPPGGDQLRAQALGSGVIVDPKGYILTNRHVVEKADRIWVKLMDDPEGAQGHRATVVGSDPETDIAVIKIDADRPLPAAKIGNSDALQVGDWVLAIGSPFGLRETVTAGIVSALGRGDIPGSASQGFQKFIQTDAAINPGNSGGPLVNMRGEVVGINTAILTEAGGYQGVGFAMPMNTIAPVYNQLVGPEHKVSRGSIGIQFQVNPNPALARVYGSGVTVSEVTPGGPAEKAGIKVGDVITAIDGKNVKTGDELLNQVASKKPGTKVSVTYVRNDKKETTSLVLADRSKLIAEAGGENEEANAEAPAPTKLGITVRNITPDMAERLGTQPGQGVIVTDVRPGSFGDDLGLVPRVVITEINKQPVRSEQDFQRITSALKAGQDVVIVGKAGRGRNAQTRFFAGTLPTTQDNQGGSEGKK